MKAIILAAGYATRMYPFTKDKPKPLLKLGGRPVIDYITEQINRLPNIECIYVVTNDKFYPLFREWAVESGSSAPVEILNDGTSSESDMRGAIGDIFFTLNEKKIDEDIFITVGDNYFTYDLLEYYNFFREKDRDTVCVKRIGDRESLKRFAVAVLDAEHKIVSLVEKPPEPPSDIAVFGAYFYKRDTLPLFSRYLGEGNTPDAPGYFPQWLYTKKDIYAYVMDGECYDIGTIQAYEEVNNMLLNRRPL